MPEPVQTVSQPERPAWRGCGDTWTRHPAIPYIVPFAAFMLILAVQDRLGVLGVWEAPLRFLVLGVVTAALARRVLGPRPAHPVATVLVGIAVFGAWIAPDLLWPGLRRHWLFQNAVLGSVGAAPAEALRGSALFLVFRCLRAVVIVPVVEELFWRGWLMRWLVRSDFESVPLGTYTHRSFWISAFLFAAEHGPFWDVGLAAGIAYNLWIIRTKRLGDCILAHAVTNASLSAYVVWTGQWQYWP